MASQDLTITILGSHMRRTGGRVWSGGMVTLLGELGFSMEAVRAALARLVIRGMLERQRDGRRINYTLTPHAQELLAEGDRRIFSFGRQAPGGDAWTLLWHSIPEDRRMERWRMALRLRFLGFGSLQHATWIAASDREVEVRMLIDQLAVGDYVSVFPARILSCSERALLTSAAWDLDALAPRYEEFVAEFSPLERARRRRALSDREAFVARARLMHSFRRFSLLDPELPDQMVPLHQRRARAVATFDAVYDGLTEASQRHFEAVAVPGSTAFVKS
ncbi:MAG TPA: PaaX family transcriptional regulator C-terminal domain-containing protein [Solirubrobacterales bacterium]|jgi:phenylacetic acid degradation operon negative regulatory protein